MNDEGGHFTVLTEWGSRIFFDVHGRAYAFTGSLPVPPRRTSDCDLPQMKRGAIGAVAERPSSGIPRPQSQAPLSATESQQSNCAPVQKPVANQDCTLRSLQSISGQYPMSVPGTEKQSPWTTASTARVRGARNRGGLTAQARPGYLHLQVAGGGRTGDESTACGAACSGWSGCRIGCPIECWSDNWWRCCAAASSHTIAIRLCRRKHRLLQSCRSGL